MNNFTILTFFITNNVIFSQCYVNNKNDKQHVDNNNNNNNNNDNKKNEEDNKKNEENNKKKELDNLIKNSVDKTIVIKEVERLHEFKTKNNNCKVEMHQSTTIDSALFYIKNNPNNKVCILNFANWISPGGNQEGSIRNTTTIDKNLYCKIAQEEFYGKHNSKDEKRANDDIIYSPDVIILQDDSNNKLSDFNNKVDIISCAAPNNISKTIPNDDLKNLHNKRMKKILDVADKYDVDILILGAFGCGVFKNPAELVAKEYSEILKNKMFNYKTKFKKIVFAIPDDENYNHFNKVFNNFTFD